MALNYGNTNIPPSSGNVIYNGTSLDKVIYNGTTVWEKIKFVAGGEYDGNWTCTATAAPSFLSVGQSGSMKFRCIYNSGNTYYFQGLTNLNPQQYSLNSPPSDFRFTVTINGKTVTDQQLITYDIVSKASQEARTTGFVYWTSSHIVYSNHYWYVYIDGSLDSDYWDYGGSAGVAPAAIISL